MRYLRFVIGSYRAVDKDVVVDISKKSLIPIIGVNECGKTTILQAIFAFDFYNDNLNEGKHLKDINNLYRTETRTPLVSAVVELTWKDFRDALSEIKDDQLKSAINTYNQRKKTFEESLHITRNLSTKAYEIESSTFRNKQLNNALAKEILRKLPYILYFDDFRDSVEDRIEIMVDPKTKRATGWLAIMEELFQQTDKNFSVFALKDKEARQRKSILAKVEKKLNTTLTKDWQDFRLDDSDALRISIEYNEDNSTPTAPRQYLQMDIVEKDHDDNEHFFFIRDRSKGFYWFFNFVMKLEFNPKSIGPAGHDSTYLLDEPGSYLHASAQMKLCKKLSSLSTRNKVIYCTHSHYLLDPDVIPLSNIAVADKDASGNISLLSLYDYKGNVSGTRSAFQPLLDALQIKPLFTDILGNPVMIVEGIYDYYAFEMFKPDDSLRIIPCCGADSVRYFISLMIAWRADYKVLWDNDSEGRVQLEKARTFFGEREAEKRFRLIPASASGGKKILQSLFSGDDLKTLREALCLPKDSAFERAILALFYSPERKKLLGAISDGTRRNFEQVFDSLH